MINRPLREFVKRSAHSLLSIGQRVGVDILPRHFYSEVPDLRTLAATDKWRVARSLHGINGASLTDQVEFIDRICGGEAASLPDDLYQRAVASNGEDGGFGAIEADFLYCFLRSTRPKRVVQIGCGVSTAVILEAATSVGLDLEITCIDPYPTTYLEELSRRDPRVNLVVERAQDVDLELLIALGAGDLFFVDSTHTVKPDSEVNRIVFEVLPRLAPDVWVHFHDIYLPYDYAPDLLTNDLFFWSETALLHAFLIGNDGYLLCVAQSMIHHRCPEALARHLPLYVPRRTKGGLFVADDGEFPASMYLRTASS